MMNILDITAKDLRNRMSEQSELNQDLENILTQAWEFDISDQNPAMVFRYISTKVLQELNKRGFKAVQRTRCTGAMSWERVFIVTW